MSKPSTSKTAKSNLESQVMNAIHDQKIAMKPKAYFVFGSLLLGGGLALAFLLTLAFLTAGAFHLRTLNPTAFLRYGQPGSLIFFRLFPWKPLILAILGISGGLWLLKKYDLSYKTSFLGISAAFIGALVIFALTLDRLEIGDRLRQAQPLAPLYRQNLVQNQMIMGEVVAASDSALIVQDPRTHQNVEINWDAQTRLPSGSDFTVGDRVGAIGEFEDDVFQADGIHKGGMNWHQTPSPLEPDDLRFHPRLMEAPRRFRN